MSFTKQNGKSPSLLCQKRTAPVPDVVILVLATNTRGRPARRSPSAPQDSTERKVTFGRLWNEMSELTDFVGTNRRALLGDTADCPVDLTVAPENAAGDYDDTTHPPSPQVIPRSPRRRERTKDGGGNQNAERKRHGARNQNRHKLFVKWLIDTFDLESSSVPVSSDVGDVGGSNPSPPTSSISSSSSPISSSSSSQHNQPQPPPQRHHVLDVAGGKGEVSARLCICHRQRVVMVDPRPADVADCFERLVLPKIPNRWQHRLTVQRAANPTFVEDTVRARFRQLTVPLDGPSLEGHHPELHAAVRDASLLVGLHADGATEAIVDAALKYRKPFVVVPCCVFPNLFASRMVPSSSSMGDGRMVPVRSHEQFCDYLALKDSRFRTEELPFEGRNIAIWWDGKE